MKKPRSERSLSQRHRRAGEINKWGYSILAGTISLAFAVAPGGISGVQGFALGFSAVFVAILLIEMSVAFADR